MDEIAVSLKLVRKIVDGSRRPVFTKAAQEEGDEVPEGRGSYAAVNPPRGEPLPHRLRRQRQALLAEDQRASFKNLQVVPHILPGAPVADVVAILGSLDPVLGDVDR
jgi:NADH:ubiquinone oxidoreductase subunit D